MKDVTATRFTGRVGLIGAGRLGAALATALGACGYRVDIVASRRVAAASALAERLGPHVRAAPPSTVAVESDLVILAVPDAAIEDLASTLTWSVGQAVVHCSGALGLDVLGPVAAAGGLAGCLHPLQSFAGAQGAIERFRGVTCGVEASEPLGGWLEAMVLDLGAHPLRLEGINRALYHAAAVLASNDVVALVAAATRVWRAAGLPEKSARGALAPLLLGAAENIEAHPLERALTGPVARGDVATVARHLEALATTPDVAALYRALGRELLRLPLALAPAARVGLEALLGEPAKDGA